MYRGCLQACDQYWYGNNMSIDRQKSNYTRGFGTFSLFVWNILENERLDAAPSIDIPFKYKRSFRPTWRRQRLRRSVIPHPANGNSRTETTRSWLTRTRCSAQINASWTKTVVSKTHQLLLMVVPREFSEHQRIIREKDLANISFLSSCFGTSEICVIRTGKGSIEIHDRLMMLAGR